MFPVCIKVRLVTVLYTCSPLMLREFCLRNRSDIELLCPNAYIERGNFSRSSRASTKMVLSNFLDDLLPTEIQLKLEKIHQ